MVREEKALEKEVRKRREREKRRVDIYIRTIHSVLTDREIVHVS
jgi:hypothetical protein